MLESAPLVSHPPSLLDPTAAFHVGLCAVVMLAKLFLLYSLDHDGEKRSKKKKKNLIFIGEKKKNFFFLNG